MALFGFMACLLSHIRFWYSEVALLTISDVADCAFVFLLTLSASTSIHPMCISGILNTQNFS